MKERYEELELEVIRFKTEDIITTSDATTSDQTPADPTTGGGTNGGSSETEQGETNQIPDGYTPTGDVFTDMYGTTYPVFIKDGDPSQLYIKNGKEMVALTMPT